MVETIEDLKEKLNLAQQFLEEVVDSEIYYKLKNSNPDLEDLEDIVKYKLSGVICSFFEGYDND
jgi:anaerobic ribonucleoside-triphosphate reductase